MAGSSGTAERSGFVSGSIHGASSLSITSEMCCNSAAYSSTMKSLKFTTSFYAGSSFRRCVPALLGATSLLCLAQVPTAQAETYVPAFTFTTSPPKTNNVLGDGNVLGYHFSTNINRKIKGVGIYNTTHLNNSLGIWNFTVNPFIPIFQVVLTSKGVCASDGFCWLSADSLGILPELLPGNDYVIAAAWGKESVPTGIETTGLVMGATDFVVGENAHVVDVLPSLDADLSADPNYSPIYTSPADLKGFFTANLSFETYSPPSVQAPAPLPLVGVTAAFAWSRKIRRRISSSS